MYDEGKHKKQKKEAEKVEEAMGPLICFLSNAEAAHVLVKQ